MTDTQTTDLSHAHSHAPDRLPMVYPDAPENNGHSEARHDFSEWRRPARLASILLATISITGTTLGGIAALVFLDITFAAAAVLTLGVGMTLAGRGLFRTRMVPDLASMVSRVTSAGAVGSMGALGFITLTPIENVTAVEFLWLSGLVVFGSLVGQHVGTTVLRRQWARGVLRSQALIVGVGRLAQELAIEIASRPTYGVDVLGFVVAGPRRDFRAARPVLGRVEDLSQIAHDHGADRIILAPIGGVGPEVITAIRRSSSAGLSVFVVPRLYEMGLGMDSLSPDRVRGYPLVRLQRVAHPRLGRFIKRFFDIVVSAFALLVVSPVLLLGALGVRLSGKGDVLFRQERIGQDGATFELLKLRTMVPSDKSDTQWVASDRITPVGGLLRRTAIDELPQLLNVLRGDMSLVGPRPERPSFVEQFEAEVPGYADRHRMPVGLTGLAQIVGLRGDTSITERVKYDNIYIDQWSFWGDIQIIVKTVSAVVRQGSLSDDHVELSSALEDLLSPATATDH